MYIYFKASNEVLTCEDYPQVFSVEYIKLNKLENMCNKWEKKDNVDGTFTLSYIKDMCSCDNSQYIDLKDYNDYECYNCCITKTEAKTFKNGESLYLQNSGNLDIVCVSKNRTDCKICEVDGYPNVYKWDDPNGNYILHINNGVLSDENISNIVKESCHIIFTDLFNYSPQIMK